MKSVSLSFSVIHPVPHCQQKHEGLKLHLQILRLLQDFTLCLLHFSILGLYFFSNKGRNHDKFYIVNTFN